MTWTKSVLVVANVTATSDELLDALKAQAQREPSKFTLIIPATPFGVLRLLQHYDVPLRGRHAVVLGRSHIVGRPLATLLSSKICSVPGRPTTR